MWINLNTKVNDDSIQMMLQNIVVVVVVVVV
jgi:hypothetical protein